MRPFRIVAILSLSIGLFAQAQTNQAPLKDAQAMQIVSRAVQASGGIAALNSIKDLVEGGDISFNWGTQEVHGSVVVRAIGTTDFRLEANLAGGVQRWFVSRGVGSLQDFKGHSRSIPYHSGANFAALTLPILKLAEQSSDPLFQISYIGEEDSGSAKLYHLRLQNTWGQNQIERTAAHYQDADYFIDASTFLIVRVEDTSHALENAQSTAQHAIEYSDYRQQDGVTLPFCVLEKIAGTRTWTLQLSDAKFNNGLSAADISF